MGRVSSLARPGGNATGINFLATEVIAKRLALMHELLPKAHRFAVLVNPAELHPQTPHQKRLKMPLLHSGWISFSSMLAATTDINFAFAAFASEKVDALVIAGGGFCASRAVQLATLAARERIPASFTTRPMVEAELLMSSAPISSTAFAKLASIPAAFLKGAKPADLPVLQSTKYQFVINFRTAKSLSVEMPPILLRAPTRSSNKVLFAAPLTGSWHVASFRCAAIVWSLLEA